jgi:4-methylaminobutanoate oxidase (formaldehyde-forming)
VPVALGEPGTKVAIDIFGDWIGGEVRADPLYDPKGERIRA